MNLSLKILLGLSGLLIVLGVLFYLWMWWAWTPKRPGPSTYSGVTVKEGILARDLIDGGIAYKIARDAVDPQAPKEYSVFIWRPGHEQDARSIAYVEGSPVPQDVKITQKGYVEIHFDGPLQGGQTGLNIAVDEEFYRYDGVRVIDGVLQ